MAIHSSILAWRIPWTEKPVRLQSLGSQRVGHDRATNTHMQGYKEKENKLMRTWTKMTVEMTGRQN